MNRRQREHVTEHAVRLELTIPDLQSGALATWRRAQNWNGRRDSNSRLEFGRLACFQLHHFRMVGEDRVELSPRVPRTRMLTLHHTPKNGGTERTRTVIGLIDNQVPHLSATVPCEKFGWVEGSRTLTSRSHSAVLCHLSYDPHMKGDK